jgi:capsid portal protein
MIFRCAAQVHVAISSALRKLPLRLSLRAHSNFVNVDKIQNKQLFLESPDFVSAEEIAAQAAARRKTQFCQR